MSLSDNPWGGGGGGGGGGAAEEPPRRLGGPKPPLSKRLSQKFERTKEVASVGVEKTKEKSKVVAEKVKEGASSSVNWMKLKYQKNMLFQPKKK